MCRISCGSGCASASNLRRAEPPSPAGRLHERPRGEEADLHDAAETERAFGGGDRGGLLAAQQMGVGLLGNSGRAIRFFAARSAAAPWAVMRIASAYRPS
jgi:hypothetical protein